MQKARIIIVLAALCASGCNTGYRVHVNGYSELTAPIASNAVIYVSTDPNAPNPIFDRQIKASAEALLRGHGYALAEAPGQADYRIDFQVGVRSENVTGYTPVYSPYFGARGGYPGSSLFGFTSYVPYVDTFYDQWLILRLLRPDAGDSETDDVVWVGEAVTSADKAELRETIDYLLIGGIEFLGVDTGRKVTLRIKKDDPRIVDLAHE